MASDTKNGASNGGTNGAPTSSADRYQRDKVRVAIIGVGNCASAFVQGVEYYKNADATLDVPGLMHVDLGGYHVSDIEFTARSRSTSSRSARTSARRSGPIRTTR
jgi:hypothetical protein